MDEYKDLNQDLSAESDLHLATVVATKPDPDPDDGEVARPVSTKSEYEDDDRLIDDDGDDNDDEKEIDVDNDEMSTPNQVTSDDLSGKIVLKGNDVEGNDSGMGNSFGDDGVLITTNYLYKEALNFNRKKDKIHPVVRILDKMNKTEGTETGWLRVNEAIAASKEIPNLRSFLSDEERELVLKLVLPLKLAGVALGNRMAFAWGVTKRSIERMIKRARSSDDLTVKRKKRSDFGTTLMNSEQKRTSVITDYHIFKKYIQKQHSQLKQQQQHQQPLQLPVQSPQQEEVANSDAVATGKGRKRKYTGLPIKEIKQMWENLPEHEKQQYKVIAEEHRSRNETLLHEIERVMTEQGVENINLSARQLVRDFSSSSDVPITNRTTLLKQIKMLKVKTGLLPANNPGVNSNPP